MGFRYSKSPEELKEALREVIEDLRQSNAGYDRGRLAEARRIAAALYMLFAHWRQQKALVRLTGVKARLGFPDSREYVDPLERKGMVCVGPPLCAASGDGTFHPRGEDDANSFPKVPFSRWWAGVVYRTVAGSKLSREHLILALGNQDGGRHVDEVLKDEAYYNLKHAGDFHLRHEDGKPIIFIDPEWSQSGRPQVSFKYYSIRSPVIVGVAENWPPPSSAQPLTGAHWASVRQIGWEADRAFKDAGF